MAGNPLDEMRDVEVEQQTCMESAQLKVRQHLCAVVNGQDGLDSFNFHEDALFYAKVNPISGIDLEILVEDWQHELRLDEQLDVTSHFLECPTPSCRLREAVYRPEEEGLLALRGYTFGLDVVALVGELRYGSNRSIPEIHAHLLEAGLEISDKEVSLLSEVFLALVTTKAASDSEAVDALRALGGIVLSIDGVQPSAEHVEAGSYKLVRPFLFVWRKDHQLGELASGFLDYVLGPEGQRELANSGLVRGEARQ